MPYTGDVDGVCGKGKTPSVRRRIFSKQRYEKFSSCRQSPAIFSSLGREVQVLKKTILCRGWQSIVECSR